jgi:Zn-dependent protease
MVDKLINYIAVFIALLLVLPIHEFAHAFVAHKCGDNTPKVNGRLTLNPLAHVDPYGLVAIVLVHFGWGKPVPINPANFKRYKLGLVLVSIAGVVANYVLAFLTYPILLLIFKAFTLGYIGDFGYFDDVLLLVLWYLPSLSINFAVFNILPFYPLDGFKLVEALDKKRGPVYRFLRKYGQYILLSLLLLGIIADITGLYFLDIFGFLFSYLTNGAMFPISAFWGLFF